MIPVSAVDGVRYTVPQVIRPACMEDTITLRFRVGSVYRDCYVSVYLGDRRIWHKKKRKLAPGEMEQVVLKKSDLTDDESFDKITVKVEEA